MKAFLCALAFVHILLTTCASAEPPPLVLDTMLLLDIALAPHRGVGGTVYTIAIREKFTSVCVLPQQHTPPQPITFADFDEQFGILYTLDNDLNKNINNPQNTELQPIGVLDALQGCYVHYNDRSTLHKPPCLAFLNSTANNCLRGEQESLFFIPAPTAVEMLAIYITRYLPQRANMREMIALSASFKVDILQTKLHLAKNKVELSPSEYKEVVFHVEKQVDVLIRKHHVMINDKWKLLQSWLNTTTNRMCSAVNVVPQWLLKPQEVTVEDIVGLVRQSISNLFISDEENNKKNNKKEEKLLLMERSFCAAASFAIAAIFLEDLNFLQMHDTLRHTSELLRFVETMDDEMSVDRNLRYLQYVVKQEWYKLHSRMTNTSLYWNCLSGIFFEDTPTIPSVATCFREKEEKEKEEVTETRWSFLTSNNTSTSSIVVNTSNAERVKYLFTWPSSKPIRFDTIQSKNSAIQTGFIDFPLNKEQFPSFPEEIIESVANKYPSNSSQHCPAGTFALLEDHFYCMDCINKKNFFIFCPGDGVIHSCSNKPDNTVYVPTGLRPSSSESCHFRCIDPYMFLLNGKCDFVPGYYMNQNQLANCTIPDTFIGSLLLPFHTFVGSGAPNIPESCSYVSRRRFISEKISQLPSPLQWCGSNTMGFSITLSTVLSGNIIQQHHAENYGETYLHHITSIAYELVAILPNGWSWYLISYFDPTPLKSPLSAITMQLAWNASFSSDLFFSVNWTLYDSCPDCTGINEEVKLNLTLSWDPMLEEVVFFVNNKIIGKPIPHRGVNKFLMENCTNKTHTHFQIAVGGWKAAYKSQMEFIGRIFSNRLPLYFEYFPGEVEELYLRNRPLSLFSLPSNKPLFTDPVNSSFSARIFTTSTTMKDLTRMTNKLQQESRNRYFLPDHICRLYSHRHWDDWGCLSCPVGSYGLLPDEISKSADSFCKCISTRHMTYNQEACIQREIGYGAPVKIVMVNTSNLFIPLTNSNFTSPVSLIRFIIDEYTRPTHAVHLLHPKIVASVDCTPGFSLFKIHNSSDESTVEVLFDVSLGLHIEMCTISGSVRMDPFLESPLSKQVFKLNFRAPPLVSNNININVSTTLAKDQYSLWLQVTGYSLLQSNAVNALELLELRDNQINILRESISQTFIHVEIQCGSNWNVSRRLLLNTGVLLPVQEGHSCTLNLTVKSAIDAFSSSIPLIFTVDSCVDGRSEGLLFFNSNLATIIFSTVFFLTSLLTALFYIYSALRDGYNNKKESITLTSNEGNTE